MSGYQPADYSACTGYPSRCLAGCKFAVLSDVYFCKAYNRRHFGQERVKVELVRDRRPWWEQDKDRRRAR